ncbi:hypothetical protein [Solwaraspora sp. WMMA2065]|uniref:hypothetical protein n=1 Tax=Solwaraspora sp. WMMA2065 TaxID=3015166 RepID=UPI00259B31C7|nr:hypothetical protein [Solwaraspora sp. WMMA2065]WJK33154.1 hypothetical protein O7610_20885 [Solwaraspora sp. WMMA2065]
MRKLWFDLRRTLQRAEEATARPPAARTGTPPTAWLVLHPDTAQLWITADTTPRPGDVAVVATHIDRTPPAGEQTPPYRQPLTEPDPNRDTTLDLLRAAARQGHRWLVADPSTPARLHTAAAYDTDNPPHAAVWTPAWLTTGDLGPYPGQTAHGYQHNGSLTARFTRTTLQRIAADTNTHAIRSPRPDTDLLVLRDDRSGMRMFVVRTPAPSAVDPTPQASVVAVRRLTADPEGWYRLTDGRWPWRQATPPADQRGDRHRHDPDVFEQHPGPTGSRCTVCGATGYDIAHEQAPSMTGHGTDNTIRCRICGSSETDATEIGRISRRAAWPPAIDPTPQAGT